MVFHNKRLTYTELHSGYQTTCNLDEHIYFANKFGRYSSKFTIPNVDGEQLLSLLESRFPGYLEDVVVYHEYDITEAKHIIERFYFPIPGEAIVYYEKYQFATAVMYHPGSDMELVEELKKEVIACISKDRLCGQISLIRKCSDTGDIKLASFDVASPYEDPSLYYNDDFMPIHEIIIDRLATPGKGIVLLHGIPGTGKTTYIRHLIHKINRRVIYVPQNMANYIASPEFLSFLMKYPRSILVIEDAENILLERSTETGNAIANLLNLSDGLLSDCLQIQIICTFNTNLSKIDKALLRKGRIIARYEFGKLAAEKAMALNTIASTEGGKIPDMTLAEIFNQKTASFEITQNGKLGFCLE